MGLSFYSRCKNAIYLVIWQVTVQGSAINLNCHMGLMECKCYMQQVKVVYKTHLISQHHNN